MTQTLYLIRGLPGSGKSTFARDLSYFIDSDYTGASNAGEWGSEWTECRHYEADQYFTDHDGNYEFDPTKLGDAHKYCRDNTEACLRSGYSAVVSNTFSTMWEMKPYVDMARELNIPFTVLTCEGNYGSIHDVPEEVIEKMRRRWEPFTL